MSFNYWYFYLQVSGQQNQF